MGIMKVPKGLIIMQYSKRLISVNLEVRIFIWDLLQRLVRLRQTILSIHFTSLIGFILAKQIISLNIILKIRRPVIIYLKLHQK